MKWHRSQEKGFSPVEDGVHWKEIVRYCIREVNTLILNTLNGSLPAPQTCVFDGQMGDQELLFTSGVFTVVTLEGPVVGVGQLMVEQQLLVVTSVIAKFTLKPAHEHLRVNHCDNIMLTHINSK